MSIHEWIQQGAISDEIAKKRGLKELVRCKDCVNSGTSRCPCHYSGDPYIDWNPDDDWFCADGERKETI